MKQLAFPVFCGKCYYYNGTCGKPNHIFSGHKCDPMAGCYEGHHIDVPFNNPSMEEERILTGGKK